MSQHAQDGSEVECPLSQRDSNHTIVIARRLQIEAQQLEQDEGAAENDEGELELPGRHGARCSVESLARRLAMSGSSATRFRRNRAFASAL